MKKQCPICGEYIEQDCEICPFCDEKIVDDQQIELQKVDKENSTTGEILENDKEEEDLNAEINTAKNEITKPNLNISAVAIIFSLAFVFITIIGTYFFLKNYNKVSYNGAFDVTQKQIEVKPKQLLPDEMDNARKYFRDKQYEKAATICEQEIEKNQNPIAYFYLGRIYQEQNYTDLAIENLKKAANIKADLYEAHYELAKIYYNKGKYDLALEYLNAANRLKKDKEVLEMLVNVYYKQENMEKSVELSRQLIKLNPDSYIANTVLYAEAIKNDDTNSAINYLKKAVEVKYNTSDAISLAKLYMSKEQYTNAIKILDRIIDKEEYNFEARRLKERSIILREEYRQNQEYKKLQQDTQKETQENKNFYSSRFESKTKRTYPPMWDSYMATLESKIKQNWHPPKGGQSKRVVLRFKIGRNGELLSVDVTKTSGVYDIDRAAITAVKMYAPFRALPSEFTGSSLEIDFTFDYNVLGR